MEELQIQIYGESNLPTLIYLPGLHGDRSLVGAFRRKVLGRVRFVEIAYPRTLDWSLQDYAENVLKKLNEAGIHEGWIIGESFSSQVAWTIVDLTERIQSFKVSGMILAGGFVKYPLSWVLKITQRIVGSVSPSLLKLGFRFFASYTKLKHWGDAEVAAELDEFVARRTDDDRHAMLHRLHLIETSDPREIARKTTTPIFHVTGFFDPIVQWPFVRPWIRKNCPALRDSRIVALADHNILGSGATKASEHILRWIKEKS